MAWEIPVLEVPLAAGADLSGSQYLAVALNGSGQAVVAGAGAAAVGILQNSPTSGHGTTVMAEGVSKAVYGGTVTAGQLLASNASGQLVPATGSALVIATALEAGASGEIHTVLLGALGTSGTLTRTVLSIPVQLAAIGSATTVFSFTPGYAGTILGASFTVTTPATTAAKAVTLTPSVAGTPTTGGAVGLTSANCTPLGANVAGTAITAGNTFTAAQTVDVKSTSVTAFAEGQGVLLLVIG